VVTSQIRGLGGLESGCDTNSDGHILLPENYYLVSGTEIDWTATTGETEWTIQLNRPGRTP